MIGASRLPVGAPSTAQQNANAATTSLSYRGVLGFRGRTIRGFRACASGMAHFELGPGCTLKAVAHRTVEELWYVLHGRGEMWRKQGEREEVIPMEPGVCLSIPVG